MLSICNFVNDHNQMCFNTTLTFNIWFSVELSQTHSNCNWYNYNIKIDNIIVYTSVGIIVPTPAAPDYTKNTPASGRVRNYKYQEIQGIVYIIAKYI